MALIVDIKIIDDIEERNIICLKYEKSFKKQLNLGQ